MDQIKQKRIVQPTPSALIDETGTPLFGTFQSPFPSFNLLDYKSKNPFRRLLNHLRLTEWQAIEVRTGSGIFLMAIYRFGVLNIHLVLFYETKTKTLKVWNHTNVIIPKSKPSKSLMNGSKSTFQSGKKFSQIVNRYEEGMVSAFGYTKNQKHKDISYDFRLHQISQPSIVNIPIKDNYPIYTEKDLFGFEGSIKIDGVEMIDGDTYAILDDHRGYYPRHSGYDWVTSFGKKEIAGKTTPFGLNCTDFRLNSNQDLYNENGFWDESNFHILDNVGFTHEINGLSIKNHHGVQLSFETLATHKVSLNLLLFKIDYKLHVGLLSGTIETENNGTVVFDKDLALCEYRYTII